LYVPHIAFYIAESEGVQCTWLKDLRPEGIDPLGSGEAAKSAADLCDKS
jgi:hypothetical protein